MQASLVLVLNCGSSSFKFAVINPNDGRTVINGLAERLNSPDALLSINKIEKQQQSIPMANHHQAMQIIVDDIKQQPDIVDNLIAIGHRVVHGGEQFCQSTLIEPDFLQKLAQYTPLAPLHNPANMLGIEVALQAFPDLPHIAVFDTAFHQNMPEKAYIYPLPYELYQCHSVRRFGFHGTSYRYVSQQTNALLNLDVSDNRIIIAHLGNGASVAAVKNGGSVDTSMGMTPNEGIVHGTRSGSIDPSIHAYLARQLKIDIAKIDEILWQESGLLGISGISNDCRTIEQHAQQGHWRSKLALEVYCYRLAKEIASLMVPLGRLDALVFTGGIGENSSLIRACVIEQLTFLNLKLDKQANNETIKGQQGAINLADHGPAVLVIPTNEERMIAQDAHDIALTQR